MGSAADCGGCMAEKGFEGEVGGTVTAGLYMVFKVREVGRSNVTIAICVSVWPYGTRMYQQAHFREMYIITQKKGAQWNVHGMYTECTWRCT